MRDMSHKPVEADVKRKFDMNKNNNNNSREFQTVFAS